MPPSHPTAAELSPIRAAPLPPTPFPHPTGSAERSAPTAAPQTPPDPNPSPIPPQSPRLPTAATWAPSPAPPVRTPAAPAPTPAWDHIWVHLGVSHPWTGGSFMDRGGGGAGVGLSIPAQSGAQTAPPLHHYLLFPFGGPLTKHQSTLTGCPISSCPFSPSMAACASLYVSYSTSVYPYGGTRSSETPDAFFWGGGDPL